MTVYEVTGNPPAGGSSKLTAAWPSVAAARMPVGGPGGGGSVAVIVPSVSTNLPSARASTPSRRTTEPSVTCTVSSAATVKVEGST